MSHSDPEPDSGTRRMPTLEKGEPDSGFEQSDSAAAYRRGRRRSTGAGDDGRPVHRFWSARRVPAFVVALLAVAGVGLLLYDVAAVRAGRSGMVWRRRLAHEWATRPLDDTWMLAGGALATVLALWLLLLALTPGLRAVLPMRRPTAGERTGDVRAGLDRSAAALVLRDRAMEVSGVQSAKVVVGRRRVKARAYAHFRDLDEVRTDLDAALADGVRELGLTRQPGLRVHVKRPRKR